MKKSDFLRHTYIVGGSGSGKTELIKTLQDLLEKNTITIDPHGDLARDLASVAHVIEPRRARFVINPFDIEDKSPRSREIGAQEITDLLKEIIRDVGLSSLMETIAFPVIYTLLKLPYADFKMFADCMSPNRGKAKLKALRPYVENIHLDIWDELEGDTYDTSKQSLFNRLQGFLNKRTILETVCGRDDFRAQFDPQRGVVSGNIVVNLAGLGSDVTETLGRLFMTRLQIWAKSREKVQEGQRTPVFLIVDEFQNFIGEHIAQTLEEYGRKFSLFVTLAHQHVGQVSSELRGSIMANMKNKIAGVSDMATRQKVAQEMGIKADDLDGLQAGNFYARLGVAPAFAFYSRRTEHTRARTPVYCPSENGADVLDGWEGFDLAEETPPPKASTTRHKRPGEEKKPKQEPKEKPKFSPKFEI